MKTREISWIQVEIPFPLNIRPFKVAAYAASKEFADRNRYTAMPSGDAAALA